MLVHDWIFTEQYLTASLMMPLAVNVFDQDEDDKEATEYERQKKRAKLKSSVISFIFMLLTALWFGFSVITGDFETRMSINIVLIYMTVVFLVSLWRIRSLIKSLNKQDKF